MAMISGGSTEAGVTTGVVSLSRRGANCTGTNGTVNRILTLTNSALTTTVIVWVNGTMLHETFDFTISHLGANSTITFLNPIWNEDYIGVLYFT